MLDLKDIWSTMIILLCPFLLCFVGELRYLYRLTPIAVVGGSFFSGLAGHNIVEAAAAGCAVLTGKLLFVHTFLG